MEWALHWLRKWRQRHKNSSISQWMRRRSFGKSQGRWRDLDRPSLFLRSKNLTGETSFSCLLFQLTSGSPAYFPNSLFHSGSLSLPPFLSLSYTHTFMFSLSLSLSLSVLVGVKYQVKKNCMLLKNNVQACKINIYQMHQRSKCF